MRSTWLQGLVFGLIAAGAALPVSCAQAPKGEGAKTEEGKAARTPAIIAKAKAAPVMDGKLDEADWQQATPVSADFVYGKKDVSSKEPRMRVRYLWDEGYLYMGYEVFDANLVALGSGEMQGPADNQRPGLEIADPKDPKKPVDVVEFFPVFEDRNLFWELHHNALNQFSDLLCVVDLPAWKKTKSTLGEGNVCWARKEFIQDKADRTFASAVTLMPRKDGKPSTVNDDSDQDIGYTGELRLPWFGIGVPVAARVKGKARDSAWNMEGRQISILAVFQNGDLEDRYHTSAENLKQTFFHLQTDLFPRYILAE